MVNAQRFRARKVDLKRPLPVFRAADLDDLEDDDNRHVDAIETGVEKDEEAVSMTLWSNQTRPVRCLSYIAAY
ncbi:hypothetical protein GGI06_003246 [Coemansia sp. S85]|nr:hypothetical protein GGI06_003246 [Coemansia sp. S85]